MAEQKVERSRLRQLIRMSKKGLPVEMIADAIGFSIDEVKAWIG